MSLSQTESYIKLDNEKRLAPVQGSKNPEEQPVGLQQAKQENLPCRSFFLVPHLALENRVRNDFMDQFLDGGYQA